MVKLKNSDNNDMVTAVDTYQVTVENTFYNLYKNIYKLSKTNNFRGETADKYKAYLETVTINYLKAFLNIAGEASTVLKDIRKCYIDLEPKDKGRISSDTLESVRDELEKRKESFEHLVSEIEKINSVPANEENKHEKTYLDGKVKGSSEISLLSSNLSLKATAGVSADLEVSGKKVAEIGPININAVNIKAGAAFLVGMDIDLTIPLPSIDW